MQTSVEQTAQKQPAFAGQRIGRWVIERVCPTLRGPARFAACTCDCGKHSIIKIRYLLTGRSLSCGCLGADRRWRKLARLETAREFRRMWNLARVDFARVSDRWRNFAAFVDDMGFRPRGKGLIRLDEGGAFERSNCYWGTRRRRDLAGRH